MLIMMGKLYQLHTNDCRPFRIHVLYIEILYPLTTVESFDIFPKLSVSSLYIILPVFIQIYLFRVCVPDHRK